MARPLALLILLALLVAAACGSSSPNTEDLQTSLPSIPAQPADLGAVVSDGSWAVAREGPVAGDAFAGATEGVLSGASQTGAPPLDAYERELESAGAVALEHPYPRTAYSVALLFESNGDAQAFYNAAEAAARNTGWLASNPELDGATPSQVELAEEPLASATVVDQLVWLHSSGIAGDQTYTDDILLIRDGRLFAMIRAPGVFNGTDTRRASTSIFETGLLIPVANRLHAAVD